MLLTYNQFTKVKFHCSWAFKRGLQHLLHNTWCVFSILRGITLQVFSTINFLQAPCTSTVISDQVPSLPRLHSLPLLFSHSFCAQAVLLCPSLCWALAWLQRVVHCTVQSHEP